MRQKEKQGQEAGTGKRILMLASVASMIDQFNQSNIRLLADMGYEVHVACNFRKGNTCDAVHIRRFRRRLGSQGVICHQWDCPRDVLAVRDCLRAFAQLLRLTQAYRFEMMHCHSPVGSALARMIAHERGIRVIYTAHGFHFYKGAPAKNWLFYYPVEKLLSYRTDVLVTINREDYLFAKRHLNAANIVRIPGVGINTGRFAQAVADAGSGADFRTRQGVPQNALLLLSVGELNEGKNHRVILEAAAQLTYQYKKKNVCCMICGIGKLQKRLKEYARSLGIEKQVFLPGYIEDMETVYAAADIFLFPSKREGMPVALMEAMAAGLPVIASDIRGCAELIDPAGGYLSAPDDVAGFAAAAAQLLEWKERFPDRLEAMGRYNHGKISDRYDISCVNKRMRTIYKDAGSAGDAHR